MNERLGEINKNKFGTEMKIIAYRKSDDIDIQFLDEHGYIFEHQTYSNFKSGGIKNPYDRNICGMEYYMILECLKEIELWNVDSRGDLYEEIYMGSIRY